MQNDSSQARTALQRREFIPSSLLSMKLGAMNFGFFVRLTGVALLYFVAAHFGLMFADVGNTVTLVWPPSGIALAAVLVFGYRMAFGIALGAFLANAWTGLPLVLASGIAIGNTLEALAGAYLLQRFVYFENKFDRRRDVFALIILAAFISTTIGAFVGATTLSLGSIISLSEYATVWLKWWLGDMMGVLVVAPPLLVWLTQSRPVLPLSKVVEAVSLLATLLIISHMIFASPASASHGYYPASLAILPFVIWAALRFDQFGATLVTLVISVMAIWGINHGTGPFVIDSSVDALFGWCIFVSVVSMIGLVLAAVSAEQRLSQATLKSANDALEERVSARTDALSQVNVTLQQEMLLRGRLETALIQVSEAQQKSIGRELHDGLGQHLASIAFFGATLQQKLRAQARPEADAAQKIVDLVNQSIDLTRRVARGLYPVALESGLVEALEQLADNTRTLKGVSCVLHADPEVQVNDPLVAINLYRIAQEAINNAVKHSQARYLWLELSCVNGNYRLAVRDDGIGFDPENIEKGRGLGMHSLRARADLLGGALEVESAQGGTTIAVIYPDQKGAQREQRYGSDRRTA